VSASVKRSLRRSCLWREKHMYNINGFDLFGNIYIYEVSAVSPVQHTTAQCRATS